MKPLVNAVMLLTLAVLVTPQGIKELVEECKKTVEIGEELEKSFLELKFPPEEKATHCLLDCIGKMLQVLDEKSGINLAMVTKLLQEVKSEGDIGEEQVKCAAEAATHKDEPCMMAFKLYECFEKEFLALMKMKQEKGE
uniref:Putative odorant-binding protein 56a n=1 Tax=Aedes albopictus TaxID=7160 RepID=A0A023EG15_AEDAL